MVIDLKFNDLTTYRLRLFKSSKEAKCIMRAMNESNICISNVTNITLTAHKRRQVY